MMKRVLYIFLLCAVFFCGICLADDDFTINTVAYNIGGFASVAVDINNNPIVCFTAVPYPGYGILYSSVQTDSGYQTEQIYSGASWPKIVVNSNNEPAVVFQSADTKLWYGTKSCWFDWVFWEATGNVSYPYPDIALTSNDIPHLAYMSSKYVEHSFFDIHSQQWSKETLTGFGNYSIACLDIDVDLSGRILIGCSDRGGNVRCAVCSNGFWNYLPAIAQANDADSCFAGDGLPAVAYIKYGILHYAVYINDVIGWVDTQVCSVNTTGHKRYSLAHSSTGTPGIAYTDNGTLRYATNVAGGWTTVEIDETGAYPELIFDHNDKPLIVYTSYDYCIGVPVVKIAGIGLEGFNIADLNNDKSVNFKDFAVMADHWLTVLPEPDVTVGDFDKNAKVDNMDLKWLSCNWLWQEE